MVERFPALRDTYGTDHCVLASDYDALEVELRAEILRLKEVCRKWCASHTGLLVAISEAGFTAQYEDYKEPCQIKDRKRSFLVPNKGGWVQRACVICQRIHHRRRAGWPEHLLDLPSQRGGKGRSPAIREPQRDSNG